MIELRVTCLDEARCNSQQHFEMFCIQRCREAGIPVRGFFFLGGVTRGKLERFRDPNNDHLVIRWTDDSKIAKELGIEEE